MRQRQRNGPLSVRAITGTYVAMLGFNMAARSRALRGLRGFAVHKTDHTTGRAGWLRGIKRFRDDSEPSVAKLSSTRQHPIQDFQWSDYSVEPGGEYTYRAVPMYGKPGALTEGDGVSVRVSAEPEGGATHSVYFNRGAAASQAYVRRFKNQPPHRTKNPAAYPWLSRGLEEALVRFIGRAQGPGWSLRGGVYEFHYDQLLRALKDAADRGVDVRIVFDGKTGDRKPRERSLKAIRAAGFEDGVCTPRCANNGFIAHNKFFVLLRGGAPVAVWTGSTNITEGGIFGHSNVGHVVEDGDVARAYLAYWEELSADPVAKDFRVFNDGHSRLPGSRPPVGTTVIFSPRGTLSALDYYAKLADKAKSSVFFTAAFGVNEKLRKVFARNKPYLRYLLLENEDKPNPKDPNIELYQGDTQNRIAIGGHLTESVLEKWIRTNFGDEELTGLNSHVRYIHTKYMLVDPLSDDPIVVTGSANFSKASTMNNDENMLVIRGDTRVADIYLGEFMRLFQHYQFRALAAQAARRGKPPKKLYLDPTDRWLAPFYDGDHVKSQERRLFA